MEQQRRNEAAESSPTGYETLEPWARMKTLELRAADPGASECAAAAGLASSARASLVSQPAWRDELVPKNWTVG